MCGGKANGHRLSIVFSWPVLVGYWHHWTMSSNIRNKMTTNYFFASSAHHSLGCATDTCEIGELIPKPAVLTNTVKLLSTLTDIDRHRNKMAINKPEVMYFQLRDRHVRHIQRNDQLPTTSAWSYTVMFCSFRRSALWKQRNIDVKLQCSQKTVKCFLFTHHRQYHIPATAERPHTCTSWFSFCACHTQTADDSVQRYSTFCS